MKAFLPLLGITLLSCSAPLSFEQFKAGIEETTAWTGGPEERFEEVGRKTLAFAIEEGLRPDHQVLDIGAGAMRVGWWFVQYIKPSNYHAIEPNREMIDNAARLIGADINIYYNSDFEFPGVKFDFVIARSIWTHASKTMISKMLSEFVENSTPQARFLASAIPARQDDEDYLGEEWVGRSHINDTRGLVRHSLSWIQSECHRRGLWLEVKGELHAQTWLLIGKVNE
jgi:hypothetical protein